MAIAIKVSKLDAARRQLQTAIELWFADGDPVSIHTLAFASHQIIHDLNRTNKGPELILDTSLVAPALKKEWIKLIKGDAEFFKHADFRRKRPTIAEFNPDLSRILMLASINGIVNLGEEESNTELAFLQWWAYHDTSTVNAEGRKALANNVPIEAIHAIRAMPKQEFLKAFRAVLSE